MRGKGVRVTYIRNCVKWANDTRPLQHLLLALCDTFQDDEIPVPSRASFSEGHEDLPPIILWCRYILDQWEVEYERFWEFVYAVHGWIRQKNIFWYTIFDQENGLHTGK